MQKVRYSFLSNNIPTLKALTDYLQKILGSFNSKKVLFHLSLTVLVHYWLFKIGETGVDPRTKKI